jgi:anti-sigma regulatory factor (Ser/Thr protein kinase)
MVATVLYMVVDAENGRLHFVSAGHPPPLLMKVDRTTSFLEHAPLPPLGVAWPTRFEGREADLHPGDTVLLYTDGLIERRGEAIDIGFARLREVTSDGPADLERLTSHVLARAPGETDLHDDAALLALRLLEPAAARLEVDLPAEPESVALVRQALERWLTKAGESEDDIFAIKLAVSEACANAIEHAYGPEPGHVFHFEGQRVQGGVLLEVSDSGRWRSPRGSQRGLGLSLIEQMVDSFEVRRTPTGTTVRMRKDLGDITSFAASAASAPESTVRMRKDLGDGCC